MHDNDTSQRPGAVGVASLPSRVLLSAALERRRHHLLALTLISLLAVPVSLELVLSFRVLVPLLFPLGALWASCLSRRERDG